MKNQQEKNMTQIATVEKLLNNAYAEISVPRKSACGHDCEECAGCGVSGAAVHARAQNPIGAQPGQKVVVQSDTKRMLGIVALVYLIPVVLFLACYLIAAIATTSVAVQYLAAAAGFAAGIVFAIRYDRKLRAAGGLTFTIVRLF
jgi:sigma-E factor negative regulatory protein RseC